MKSDVDGVWRRQNLITPESSFCIIDDWSQGAGLSPSVFSSVSMSFTCLEDNEASESCGFSISTDEVILLFLQATLVIDKDQLCMIPVACTCKRMEVSRRTSGTFINIDLTACHANVASAPQHRSSKRHYQSEIPQDYACEEAFYAQTQQEKCRHQVLIPHLWNTWYRRQKAQADKIEKWPSSSIVSLVSHLAHPEVTLHYCLMEHCRSHRYGSR